MAWTSPRPWTDDVVVTASELTYDTGLQAGYALATADAALWLAERGWHEAANAISKGAHRDAVARANGAGR